MIQGSIPTLQLRQIDLYSPLPLPARHIARTAAIANVITLQPRSQGVLAAGPREAIGVGGGGELSHFGGQKGIWPAVVSGGRPAERWQSDAVTISLEQREAEG